MKLAIAIISFLVLVVVGEWGYRLLIRPIDRDPPSVLRLAEHFCQSGIIVKAKPVRHSYRHSSIKAVAYLDIEDFPLPILVNVCASKIMAENHLQAIRSSPNLPHSLRNGLLVMCLPMWTDDEPMAEKVKAVFASFMDRT
jgi:hypothetical protein